MFRVFCAFFPMRSDVLFNGRAVCVNFLFGRIPNTMLMYAKFLILWISLTLLSITLAYLQLWDSQVTYSLIHKKCATSIITVSIRKSNQNGSYDLCFLFLSLNSFSSLAVILTPLAPILPRLFCFIHSVRHYLRMPHTQINKLIHMLCFNMRKSTLETK